MAIYLIRYLSTMFMLRRLLPLPTKCPHFAKDRVGDSVFKCAVDRQTVSLSVQQDLKRS